MDPVLLTTFGTLIVLLIFTVPIGVSIGTAVFMGMMVGGLPPVFLAQKMYSALDSFPLLAVPFFIVAGDIMQKGTIANSLLAVSRCLVGHIKGGMAHISILTSLFYGALSGSAAATVAAVGGDGVMLEEDGTLRVNGTLHAGEVLYPTYPAGGVTYPYTVPEGCLFILNDYRTRGRDSRHFGAVPQQDAAGKVITLLRRRGL